MSQKKKGLTWRTIQHLAMPVVFLLLISASVTAAFYFVFFRTPAPQPARAPQARSNPAPLAAQAAPRPEPAPAAARPQAAPAPAPKPRVAIVIDDMGYQLDIGKQLLNLDLELSFSFLPYGPYSRVLAGLAQRRGRDILLHLPMEPLDAAQWDPGPGALYLAMPTEALRLHLKKNLSIVPQALGINNHMGSKFTADREAMATVFSFLRQRELFFLDSLTTPRSVGAQLAAEMGVPALRRDIFLDNERDRAAIERQLAALIRLAQKKGAAVGIAHPHPATLAALNRLGDRLRTEVEVVGIHLLFEAP